MPHSPTCFHFLQKGGHAVCLHLFLSGIYQKPLSFGGIIEVIVSAGVNVNVMLPPCGHLQSTLFQAISPES